MNCNISWSQCKSTKKERRDTSKFIKRSMKSHRSKMRTVVMAYSPGGYLSIYTTKYYKELNGKPRI